MTPPLVQSFTVPFFPWEKKLGAEILKQPNGYLKVVKVNSHAKEQGIHLHDVIVGVDGKIIPPDFDHTNLKKYIKKRKKEVKAGYFQKIQPFMSDNKSDELSNFLGESSDDLSGSSSQEGKKRSRLQKIFSWTRTRKIDLQSAEPVRLYFWRFMPPFDDLNVFNVVITEKRLGISVEIREDGNLIVVRSEGNAALSGIKLGDIILGINFEPVFKKSTQDIGFLVSTSNRPIMINLFREAQPEPSHPNSHIPEESQTKMSTTGNNFESVANTFIGGQTWQQRMIELDTIEETEEEYLYPDEEGKTMNLINEHTYDLSSLPNTIGMTNNENDNSRKIFNLLQISSIEEFEDNNITLNESKNDSVNHTSSNINESSNSDVPHSDINTTTVETNFSTLTEKVGIVINEPKNVEAIETHPHQLIGQQTPKRNSFNEQSITNDTRSPCLSTLNPIAVSRNIVELQLSEEEKGKLGSPDGRIYVVQFLQDHEFVPSDNIHEEITQNLLLHLDDIDWGLKFQAIDTIRRICLFHSQEMTPDLLEKLFPFIKVTTVDLRSSLGKNAIQCIGNLLIKIDEQIIYKYIDECVTLLCHLCGSDKKFLSSIAIQTLSSAIESGPTKYILSALFVSMDNKNPKIISQACISIEQCLQRLKVGEFEKEEENQNEETCKEFVNQIEENFKLSEIELTKLICALNIGLKGKLASGKSAASNSLQLLCKEYGRIWFEEITKKSLSEFEAADLVRTITQKNQKKTVHKRPSLHQQLHQDNQQLHQDNQQLHQDNQQLHQDNQQLHQDNQQSDIKPNELPSDIVTKK